ncbi:PIN domain nuclease of toxin-antitoxin system [Roseiarcus fermentans]|uniref:PIN domain nuclease of toxin-antitoxin system n=1 Tax=Roseiarcus fermentans TaxID=1473586 RepID=A0A366FUG5_9HYPH|nr:type II toxin-antitoxin system VapC family toxin [Roseiarcus fermentans]RBP17339.1 PIN domain nuclease of toxin-antitoxin system [Roseiarcus fermentans]
MTEVVLDASALIALLKDEPGGAKVAGVLRAACMGAVNFAEVVSHFVHAGMPPHAVDAMLAPLPLRIVEADAALARAAGGLRKITADAGLSLGDRFCLALAVKKCAPAWTTDRQWLAISERIGAEVILIR